MIQEGYDKYHPAMFRVPYMDKWVVIVRSVSYICTVLFVSVTDRPPNTTTSVVLNS